MRNSYYQTYSSISVIHTTRRDAILVFGSLHSILFSFFVHQNAISLSIPSLVTKMFHNNHNNSRCYKSRKSLSLRSLIPGLIYRSLCRQYFTIECIYRMKSAFTQKQYFLANIHLLLFKLMLINVLFLHLCAVTRQRHLHGCRPSSRGTSATFPTDGRLRSIKTAKTTSSSELTQNIRL